MPYSILNLLLFIIIIIFYILQYNKIIHNVISKLITKKRKAKKNKTEKPWLTYYNGVLENTKTNEYNTKQGKVVRK